MVIRLRKPLAIITDIEGTTTSIRFWHEVISPFIRENLSQCLMDTWNQPETIDVVNGIRLKTNKDIQNGDCNIPPILDEYQSTKNKIIDSIVKNVHYQMKHHKQSNELKAIHLLVWLYGYQMKLLKGHLYPDVLRAFYHWKYEHNIRIFTFSTGDILVQKMIFGNSIWGNILELIDDFYNLDNIGRKTNPDSFRLISNRINVNCNCIIFLSDNLMELKASHLAGVQPILVIRSHNYQLLDQSSSSSSSTTTTTSIPYQSIKSFEELEFF